MSVTLQDARDVTAAAEQKADEISQPMNVAVADERGNLVSHIGQNGAWLGSVDISINGAVPLERDGQIFGAVGVSGGQGEQDQAVVGTGAAAFAAGSSG